MDIYHNTNSDNDSEEITNSNNNDTEGKNAILWQWALDSLMFDLCYTQFIAAIIDKLPTP